MVGPREHVYGLYFGGVVAVLVQVGQVAGQGGRITGDVDDAFGFALGDGFEAVSYTHLTLPTILRV